MSRKREEKGIRVNIECKECGMGLERVKYVGKLEDLRTKTMNS